MNRRAKKLILFLICIYALAFSASTTVFASDMILPLEFGNFAGDSDFNFGGSGGSFDFGGSSSGGASGGYDFGGSSFGGSDYGNNYGNDYGDLYGHGNDEYDDNGENYDDDEIYEDGDYDDDYDPDYALGGFFYNIDNNGSGGLGSSLISIFITAVNIAFFAFLIYRIFKRKGKKTVNADFIKPVQGLFSMSDYSELDPTFSETDFCEKLGSLYVRFQNSWQAKDLDDVRPYLSDAMFAAVDRQLNEYKNNGTTNRVEDISVQAVKLIGFKQENNSDIVVAELRTRIRDYVVDDASGKVVRGDPSKEKFMHYRWTLARTTGYRGKDNTGFTAKSCPHCGAPVDMNSSAVCEYCGSVLKDDTFDWVVNNIDAISQRTV